MRCLSGARAQARCSVNFVKPEVPEDSSNLLMVIEIFTRSYRPKKICADPCANFLLLAREKKRLGRVLVNRDC
jgi:hypothetical protein